MPEQCLAQFLQVPLLTPTSTAPAARRVRDSLCVEIIANTALTDQGATLQAFLHPDNMGLPCYPCG